MTELCLNCLCRMPDIDNVLNDPTPDDLMSYYYQDKQCTGCLGWSVSPIPLNELGMTRVELSLSSPFDEILHNPWLD